MYWCFQMFKNVFRIFITLIIICFNLSFALDESSGMPEFIPSKFDLTFLSRERSVQFKFYVNRFLPYADMILARYRSTRYGTPKVWKRRGSQMKSSKIQFGSSSTHVGYAELFKNDSNAVYEVLKKFNHTVLRVFADYHGGWLYSWLRSSAFQKQITIHSEKYDNLWMLFVIVVRTARDMIIPGRGRRMDLGITFSDHLATLFIVQACENLRGNEEIFQQICPDVCLARPCASISYTATSKCFGIGKQMYRTDFKCKCIPNYRFSMVIKECEPFNPCYKPNFCFKEGTLKCVYHTEKNEGICICKTSFMGSKCQARRNPCFKREDPLNIAGQRACAVSRGNRCKPVMGTDTYSCDCQDQWLHDFTFPYPNCYAFRDRCSNVLCINGDCVSSIDGRRAKCVCPPEYSGRYCEKKQSTWGFWSPWTDCDPRCGIVRRRVRIRLCNGEMCEGNNYQARMCDPDYCGNHPRFAVYCPFRWKLARYFGFLGRWLVTITTVYAIVAMGLMLVMALLPSIAADLVILMER